VRLKPSDPPAATLALGAAVALHEVISASCDAVWIKWPNDLMAGDAKLAGILLERAQDCVVVGFGVNLAHHPETLERPVTSVARLIGTAPAPDIVARDLAAAFASWLDRWRQGLEPVRRAWLQAAHPVGTSLSSPEGVGAFEGLDEGGALKLRMPDGGVRLIHAGDVFLV
jgi:BirA family biotin operon repressor/biotin-[acetyl-CoA-carboxylase] ligase